MKRDLSSFSEPSTSSFGSTLGDVMSDKKDTQWMRNRPGRTASHATLTLEKTTFDAGKGKKNIMRDAAQHRIFDCGAFKNTRASRKKTAGF